VSPSPYEVSKERGRKRKEGLPPLLDTPFTCTEIICNWTTEIAIPVMPVKRL